MRAAKQDMIPLICLHHDKCCSAFSQMKSVLVLIRLLIWPQEMFFIKNVHLMVDQSMVLSKTLILCCENFHSALSQMKSFVVRIQLERMTLEK